MKKYVLFFFFNVHLVLAQSGLTNITNYCTNSVGDSPNYTYFEQIGNLLLFRTAGNCTSSNPQGAPFKLWIYDGINAPYNLKFPDGSVFYSLNDIERNDIVKLGEKVYLNCNSDDDTKDGLYFFDPSISVTYLSKVVVDNFPNDCKDFRSLAKFNNGLVYESFVEKNCFYNPSTNISTYLLSDFRENNFRGRYFSNSELNGNFYYTAVNEAMNSMVIKKYIPSNNITETITDTPSVITPYPNGQIVFSNKLYYINKKNNTGVELFQYDGTSETAIDINSGTGSSYPNLLTVVNNKLYFTCYYNSKYYLYKYDGINPPEIIHQTNFNIADFYSGMCELNNELYIVKSYVVAGGIKTDLYKYSETSNNLILLNTFDNFLTSVTNINPEYTFYGPAPQYYQNKRGHLINFKNELYILGRKLNGNTAIGAVNDIWKLNNETLNISKVDCSQDIKFYPNPTKSDVMIDFEKNYKFIEVYTNGSDGKIINKNIFNNTGKVKIKLPQVNGIYYITILYDNKKSIHKVIKE
ncbi:T9SS type A sorting domain-containing protein [Chryseobacterium aureum]|uniref:T9SS type A sorting domain-containing protein n=1 Tax=Chryseobacterium aureum TaxID=2497456 RepID=UPI000F89081E|nr:T9SS type A sorting domain-containing protein [Chryseobacterium aureum]